MIKDKAANTNVKVISLPLKDLSFGGWKASEAQVQGSSIEGEQVVPSIGLITFQKGKFRKRVRLDLGKGLFLDSMPIGVKPDAGRELAISVATKWSKRTDPTGDGN